MLSSHSRFAAGKQIHLSQEQHIRAFYAAQPPGPWITPAQEQQQRCAEPDAEPRAGTEEAENTVLLCGEDPHTQPQIPASGSAANRLLSGAADRKRQRIQRPEQTPPLTSSGTGVSIPEDLP